MGVPIGLVPVWLRAVWMNRGIRPWPGDDAPVALTDLLELERWLEQE